MARPLKWIFGIIAGVIVLCVIAVVIILSSYNFNNLKPVISKAVYDATGRKLVIGSNIDLDIGLSPSLVLSDIEFQNAAWGTRKNMVKISRFEVKVALLPLIRGNIDVKRFILKDPDILIETNKNGKTNLEFKSPEKAPAAKKSPEAESKPAAAGQEEVSLPALTINELEIINGTLTYRDGKTGKTETVALKSLKADIKGLDNPLNFNLDGAYNDAPFIVKGTLGSIRDINDPNIPWPVDIAVNAFGTNSTIKGSIKNPMEQQGINIDFDVKIDDWNRLSEVAGSEIPIKDKLGVSGNFADVSAKGYQIKNFKISLGKNLIDGSIGMNIAGKVPFIDAVLSSKELDLRNLMPEGKEAEKTAQNTEKAPTQNERIFSDDPLPLDSLRLADGVFKLRFDKVVMPKMVVSNLVIDSTLNKGNLTVKPFKANMGGGSINIETDILSKGKSADLSFVLNVKDFEIADMLAEAGSNDALEGRIDADIDVRGSGNSVASIMGGLNGYTRVIMGEGKIDNKIIDEFGGDLSKGIFRLLNPAIDKKKYTTFECMVTRFDIRDGIADATAFVFNTSMMTVVGEGDINLKTETLDLSLNPSTKGDVAGYNLNLGELTQPFILGGTLAKPSLVLDKEKTALAIGKVLGKRLLKDKTESREAVQEKSSEEDVCASALQAARTGVKQAVKKDASSKEDTQQVTPEKLLEEVVKDPKKALKNFLGR